MIEWKVGKSDSGNYYVTEQAGNEERFVAFRVKDEQTAVLVAFAPKLKEAVEDAVVTCGCSVKERYSGHRTGCPAPAWLDLLLMMQLSVKEARTG